MLRSAAGGAVIQAGLEREYVSPGECRGDAAGVPQGAPEGKAQRPPVRVLTPNPQPAPSKPPPASYGLATPSKAIPR